MKVIDGVGLLKNNVNWTKNDQSRLENWFNDFLKWFVTSKNGIDEMNAKNNHGVWYDAQKLAYALFTHHDELAESAITQAQIRLNEQMDTTGFFPAELDRTISLHYSAFIMEPYFFIAQMSDKIGVDMWHYTTTKGCSVEKGFKALSPYLSKQKEWFGQQIKPYEYMTYSPTLLAQGYQIYHCDSCKEGMKEIAGEDYENNIQHLLCIID
jgi:hypothetical protein